MTSSLHLLRIQKPPVQSGTGDWREMSSLERKTVGTHRTQEENGDLHGHMLASFKGSFTFFHKLTRVFAQSPKERLHISPYKTLHCCPRSRPCLRLAWRPTKTKLQTTPHSSRSSPHGAVMASYGCGLLGTLTGLRCTWKGLRRHYAAPANVTEDASHKGGRGWDGVWERCEAPRGPQPQLSLISPQSIPHFSTNGRLAMAGLAAIPPSPPLTVGDTGRRHAGCLAKTQRTGRKTRAKTSKKKKDENRQNHHRETEPRAPWFI